MKKSIFILWAIFLLSACQQPEPELDLTLPADQLPPRTLSCDDLKTDQYRIQCEERLNTVAGQILADEVIKTFDLERCENLSYDKIENCQNRIQTTGITGPITLEQVEALEQAMRPVANDQNEVLEYNLETCQNLPVENGLKTYCETQVQEKKEGEMLRRQVQNNEATDCELFESKTIRQQCENLA